MDAPSSEKPALSSSLEESSSSRLLRLTSSKAKALLNFKDSSQLLPGAILDVQVDGSCAAFGSSFFPKSQIGSTYCLRERGNGLGQG